jgi:hypothetical protein
MFWLAMKASSSASEKGSGLPAGSASDLAAGLDDMAGEDLLHVREIGVALGLAPEQHLGADLAQARWCPGDCAAPGESTACGARHRCERERTRQHPALHHPSLTRVAWTTSMPPPRKPPSQYIR